MTTEEVVLVLSVLLCVYSVHPLVCILILLPEKVQVKKPS